MTRHIVKIEELKDWTFEQIVCAAYPKKLTLYVNPYKDAMHYKLYYKDEVIGMFGSLDYALTEYNES